MGHARTAAEPPARERILESARRLFYERGIRAVGVEAVVEDAGVTKMSLYRHFASKDELVAACLGEREAAFWAWFDGKLAEHPGEPRAQLLALFRGLAKRTTAPGFRGCPMTNAAIEFPEPDHPGRRVAETHKRELRERLRELAAGDRGSRTRGSGRRAPAPVRGRLRQQPDIRARRPRPLGGAGGRAPARHVWLVAAPAGSARVAPRVTGEAAHGHHAAAAQGVLGGRARPVADARREAARRRPALAQPADREARAGGGRAPLRPREQPAPADRRRPLPAAQGGGHPGGARRGRDGARRSTGSASAGASAWAPSPRSRARSCRRRGGAPWSGRPTSSSTSTSCRRPRRSSSSTAATSSSPCCRPTRWPRTGCRSTGSRSPATATRSRCRAACGSTGSPTRTGSWTPRRDGC